MSNTTAIIMSNTTTTTTSFLLQLNSSESRRAAAFDDPFCEAQFWEENGLANTGIIANPMGTATAFLMIAIACVNNYQQDDDYSYRIQHKNKNKNKISRLFLMCKASLALTGIGTIFFHSMKPQLMADAHLNHGLCDWFPITLLCSNILILYFDRLIIITKHNKRWRENIWLAVLLLVMIWVFVLVVGMDSDTDAYYADQMGSAGNQGQYGTLLNALLLVPLALTLAYASFYHFEWRHSKYLALGLSLTLILWLINAYLCKQHPWLSLFHAIYHVTIAYSFIYAACLGIAIEKSKYQFELSRWGWPCIIISIVSSQSKYPPSELFMWEEENEDEDQQQEGDPSLLLSSSYFYYDST